MHFRACDHLISQPFCDNRCSHAQDKWIVEDMSPEMFKQAIFAARERCVPAMQKRHNAVATHVFPFLASSGQIPSFSEIAASAQKRPGRPAGSDGVLGSGLGHLGPGNAGGRP